MNKHFAVWFQIWLVVVCVAASLLSTSPARSQELSQILKGFEIAPVNLNLKGKNWALVGLGSYIVNTTGCNDCHTFPNWAPGGNPYLGQPEQINTDRYLAGGRVFTTADGKTVVAVSANITPDKGGKPAGLSWGEFRDVMRSGKDPDVKGRLLQVMPWPLYRWKTELELTAMYEYLRAIPSCADAPPPTKAC